MIKLFKNLFKKPAPRSFVPPIPSATLKLPEPGEMQREDQILDFIYRKWNHHIDRDSGMSLGRHWSQFPEYAHLARNVKIRTTLGWRQTESFTEIENVNGISIGTQGVSVLRLKLTMGKRKELLDHAEIISAEQLMKQTLFGFQEVRLVHPADLGSISTLPLLEYKGDIYWNMGFSVEAMCADLILRGYYDFYYCSEFGKDNSEWLGI